MQPISWSTTYNEQYRDRRRYVTPFPGSADTNITKSRTQGYYGPRAALAEHAARTAELQARGLTAPFTTSTFSSTTGSTTARGGYFPYGSGSGGGASHAFNEFSTSYGQGGSISARGASDRIYGYREKDLWTHPIVPHTGVYSNSTTIRGGVRPSTSNFSAYGGRSLFNNNMNGYTADPFVEDPRVGVEKQYSTTTTRYGSGGGDVEVSTRYDAYGVSETKYVDVTRSCEPKNKYHIPGYAGNVRGMQFVHGDTYGKTTRKCLDVPNEGF